MSTEGNRLLRYRKDIPKQLHDILLPKNKEELEKLEINLLARDVGRADRRRAFTLWQQYNLPLKYRRMISRYAEIKVRLIELIKRLTNRWRQDNDGSVL